MLSLLLQAKPPLPPLELKLYRFIQQTQYQDHPIKRYIGTWPSYPKYSGVRKEIPESNVFMTLQTILLLDDVNRHYALPGFDALTSLANAQILAYVADGHRTHEPAGTIAFWPLLQSDEGEWIRSFDIQWYNTSMRILNIANDFDTSSQAFAWFYRTRQQPQFMDGFIQSLGRYRDLNRSLEHPLNTHWKAPESGAFMTWAEEELPHKDPNRIMDLINDVDCVVNLNILTDLSLYENTMAPLPKMVKEGKQKSCELIHNVLIKAQEHQCATWYTRPSHLYLAFAKAYEADTYCVQSDKDIVLKRAQKRARYLLKHPRMEAYTEIAEHLIILKTLKPPNQRSLLYQYLIQDLVKMLKKGIVQREDYAYLPSKHSLFGGEAFGLFHFDWYGRANATALALKAISMK